MIGGLSGSWNYIMAASTVVALPTLALFVVFQKRIIESIKTTSNRKKRIRHDKQTYKDRNVIERGYCRLKDFRRIATRYDKLARNYFSALCLVAAVAFWL